MKLRGILDSHARRAEWERRQERDAPKSEQPAQRQHDPQPQPDGTIRCCGALYARHAHEVHFRGEPVAEWRGGVGVVSADCPPTIGEEMARARMYVEQSKRDRQRQQRVDGADDNYMGC